MHFEDLSYIVDYIHKYSEEKPSKTPSSIGKIFSEHGVSYFYDSGTNKVVMLDEGTLKFIECLIAVDNNLSNLERIAMLNDVDIEKTISFINEEDLLKGFCLTHLYSENYLEHVENQMKNRTSQLILELTGKCNMRCRYCIYHEGYPKNRSFTSKRMSKETALNTIDFIKDHGDQQEAFITFYGGEPLLEFDLLKDVIEYAKKELSERNLFFSFTTNLSLLTADMAEYLARVGDLSIMCSIDGPKEIHDAHRIYANGKGSFDDVYRNFRLLNEKSKEHGNSINISVNAVYMPPFSYKKV